MNATPTSSVCRAFSTVWPRPGASISAATVTIESAAMIVWLMPTTTVDRDIGSSTLVSVCPRVDPSERAASTLSGGTERIACAVSRTAGGAA